MEPPLNHPGAFNPGLADPEVHDGCSFSVGHSSIGPEASVPIPPYADRTAAYYAACDPLTALRDAACEAMVRQALEHEREIWPEPAAHPYDPHTHDARTLEVYGPTNLACVGRFHRLALQSRADPHRPLFAFERPTVGFNIFRGDSDSRLVAECQALLAGRFDPPGAELFHPEAPWEHDWYEDLAGFVAGHSATHCWLNCCDDCYVVFTPDDPAESGCAVVLVPAGPDMFAHPVFESANVPPPTTIGVVRDLDAAAAFVLESERYALASDLLDIAVHCPSPSAELADMLEPPRDAIVRSALLKNRNHRPLDYHGTPADWGACGISAVNSTSAFVAREPLAADLDLEEPSLSL